MSIGEFFPGADEKGICRPKNDTESALKLHIEDTNPPKEKRFVVISKTINGVFFTTVYIKMPYLLFYLLAGKPTEALLLEGLSTGIINQYLLVLL